MFFLKVGEATFLVAMFSLRKMLLGLEVLIFGEKR